MKQPADHQWRRDTFRSKGTRPRRGLEPVESWVRSIAHECGSDARTVQLVYQGEPVWLTTWQRVSEAAARLGYEAPPAWRRA